MEKMNKLTTASSISALTSLYVSLMMARNMFNRMKNTMKMYRKKKAGPRYHTIDTKKNE